MVLRKITWDLIHITNNNLDDLLHSVVKHEECSLMILLHHNMGLKCKVHDVSLGASRLGTNDTPSPALHNVAVTGSTLWAWRWRPASKRILVDWVR